TFRSCPPKYPTDDPHYRILKREWSRYTHYYFYIRDEVLGPMILCVGSFLPFPTRYWINGHSFIANELQRQSIRFRKDDNTFLRLEICVNRLKDLGLNKGLKNLDALRKKLLEVTDRLAGIEGECSMSMSTFPCFSVWLFPSPGERAKSRASRFTTPHDAPPG